MRPAAKNLLTALLLLAVVAALFVLTLLQHIR